MFDKFKEDWQLKLLAFVMALLLWVYVVKIAGNKNYNHSKPHNQKVPSEQTPRLK